MKRLFPALLLLAALPAHAEIYKWVDEAGHPHFAEEVPAKYRKNATPHTPQPVNTIQGSTLRGGAGARPRSDAPPSPPADAPADAPDRTEATGSDAERCRAQQDRFRASQECFARYRNANGSLRSEAFANCEDVPQPPPCD